MKMNDGETMNDERRTTQELMNFFVLLHLKFQLRTSGEFEEKIERVRACLAKLAVVVAVSGCGSCSCWE